MKSHISFDPSGFSKLSIESILNLRIIKMSHELKMSQDSSCIVQEISFEDKGF